METQTAVQTAVAKKKLTIVTHSGQAHADDLMAIALILIKERSTPRTANIIRVPNCNAADYPDADFIVDIGKQYDPAKRWFDHHQFPKDAPAECAFTLVAKHYGIGRGELYWIERLAILDSKGPYDWFQLEFGREADHFGEVEKALGSIDVFSWFTRLANETYIDATAFTRSLEMAILWLKGELAFLANRPKNIAFAKANLEIIDMGKFKMAFFRQKEMRGTGMVCNEVSKADRSIIVTGKLDDRGDGFSALRLNNSRRVNFLPRKGEPNCIFAHENGFCLKWKNDWPSFLEAVQRSVVEIEILPAPNFAG